MSPRAVYRHVPHTIRHDPEGGVVFETHCVADGCGARPGPGGAREAAQDWALRLTGHARFRRVVTDHARVTREE